MNAANLTKVALASMAFVFSAGASAQLGGFGLPAKVAVPSGGSSAASENPSDVVKNARNSLLSFMAAKIGLIEAMGGSEDLAAQKKMLEGIKQGDAAASTEDLKTLVSLDKPTTDMINKRAAENAKLDAKNKAIAGKSMIEYVKGMVSAKKMVGSVSNLSKNPASLGTSVGSIGFLAKELPGIISSGAGTTSTLFGYLGANGVDTSEAKKAAADLGV